MRYQAGQRVKLSPLWDRSIEQAKFPPVGSDGIIYPFAIANSDPLWCPLTVEFTKADGSTWLLPVHSCEIEAA